MHQVEDSYFSDFDQAYEIAKKQRYFGAYGNLQICYYDGVKREHNLPNLIHLDSQNIINRLLELNSRYPTKIVGDFGIDVLQAIADTQKRKEHIIEQNSQLIQKKPLNFLEPLRVYMSADYGGRVVLDTYKLVVDTFREAGCEILLDINDSITIMDDYVRSKSLVTFHPHIVFTINRVRNSMLHKDTFHFAWFQDPTLLLYDNTKIGVRKRDYFFCLVENFRDALVAKGVPPDRILKQSFATNSREFFIEKGVQRENKIVFIGNNYFELISPTLEYKKDILMLQELSELFNKELLDMQMLHTLATRYLQEERLRSYEHLEMFLFNAIVRVEVLKWVCSQKEIKVEIYGEGWSHIEELAPFTKGSLHSKQEIRLVCNSAKYSFLAHPEYYYQQRLMEASACGSIPLVYEGVNNREVFEHKENVLLFHNKESLFKVISQEPKKNPSRIAKDKSYRKFIDKMIYITKAH